MKLGKRFSYFQRGMNAKASVSFARKSDGKRISWPRKLAALFILKSAGVKGIKTKSLLRHYKKFQSQLLKKED